jgi:hypothetical protein
VSTWCCGSSCCRYLSWRQDKWRDRREWRSTPFYPLLYIQIYETSSVGCLAPFLPDSEHVQLYTFNNISTHSVCGRNIEASEDGKVKIVTWFSHGYLTGVQAHTTNSVRNSVLKICVKRLKLLRMKISNF